MPVASSLSIARRRPVVARHTTPHDEVVLQLYRQIAQLHRYHDQDTLLSARDVFRIRLECLAARQGVPLPRKASR